MDKQKDKLEEAIQEMKEVGEESSILVEESQDPFQVSPQKCWCSRPDLPSFTYWACMVSCISASQAPTHG